MADPILSPHPRRLDAAWSHLAEGNMEAADRFLDEFWDAAVRHARFPLAGRSREDLRPGLPSFVVGRYVALFEPRADAIRLVRVIHSSRDIDFLMRDADDE